MDDKTARDLRTYGTIGILVFAALTFLLLLGEALGVGHLPSVSPYLPVIVGVLAVIFGVLGYVTFPSKRVAELIARRRAASTAAPSDLTRELLALVTTTKKVWSVDANFVDSFAVSNLNILNEVNQQMAKMDPSVRIFAQEANGVISGWRSQRPTHQFLVKQLDSFAEFGVGMDEDTLLVILTALVSLALSGSNTANSFAQAVSNTGLEVSKYQREGWTAFANRANRLSEDLTKLGEKVKVATGVDAQVYVPQVRGL